MALDVAHTFDRDKQRGRSPVPWHQRHHGTTCGPRSRMVTGTKSSSRGTRKRHQFAPAGPRRGRGFALEGTRRSAGRRSSHRRCCASTALVPRPVTYAGAHERTSVNCTPRSEKRSHIEGNSASVRGRRTRFASAHRDRRLRACRDLAGRRRAACPRRASGPGGEGLFALCSSQRRQGDRLAPWRCWRCGATNERPAERDRVDDGVTAVTARRHETAAQPSASRSLDAMHRYGASLTVTSSLLSIPP